MRVLDNGLVRLDFNTALDGKIEEGTSVYMTPDTAVAFSKVLADQVAPLELQMEKSKLRKGLS